jgi:hypothetical protein
MEACRADMKTLCGTVERGKGKKMACLAENRAKATPECQAALTSVEAQQDAKGDRKDRKAAKGEGKKGGRLAACRADSKSLCADVPKGGGGKLACLRTNEAKLTPDCAAAVKALPVR